MFMALSIRRPGAIDDTENRHLMASYQTLETEHEESWWEMAGFAYVNLYLQATRLEKP
jgi:hypothetical protein